jgi:hypothetical protein
VAGVADGWASIGALREDGSYGGVEQRRGWVAVFVEQLILHLTVYLDMAGDVAEVRAQPLGSA